MLAGLGVMFIGVVLLFTSRIPLMTLNWYAKYFRKAAR